MDILTEIKKILMEMLDLEGQAVTPESLLLQELGAESIDLLELAAALNARFKIEVREEDIFLQSLGLADSGARSQAAYPFLTEERFQEIAADHDGGQSGRPAVRVKDLVSYVAWQQKKAGSHVHP
jgi:acyl carrier protein